MAVEIHKMSVVAGLAILSLAAGSGMAHEGEPSRFNYRDDVRPIFLKHCAGCHRPGGVAPMSLLSYQEAVPWANAMKMQILHRQMPPWLPEEGVGAFQHARGLSAAEIDVLIDWAIGLTPEGEPLEPEESARPDVSSSWRMGEPDLVLTPAEDVVVGEDEYEKLACVVLPTGLTTRRVANAFELKPENPALLRRATVTLGTTCDGSGQPLFTWLPDQPPFQLTKARGVSLDAGTSLAVELLYVKGWDDEGKRLTDRSVVAIGLDDTAVPVQAAQLGTEAHRFESAVDLVAIYPNVTGEGDQSADPLFVEVVESDGGVVRLLQIESFNPMWREVYVLEEPFRLTAGTEVRSSQPAVWLDFIPVAGRQAE